MVRPAATSAFAVAVLSALTALAQLNPTVNVLTKPQAPVPGECEQGLAPAQPRALIAETAAKPAPAPSPSGPPPTLSLKTRLRSVESAAQAGDRDAFKTALAPAHAAVNAYPLGGERDAANDVLHVYDDLEKLWDYAFTSPSGAFFDATTDNGALLRMLQHYPGYDRSIADSTLTAGGTVIYPTTESRQFLTAEASRRLAQLGVKMPERIAEVAKPAPPPAPVVRKKAPEHVAKPKPTHKAIAHKAEPKAKMKIAEARVAAPKRRESEPIEKPAPPAVVPEPQRGGPPSPAASRGGPRPSTETALPTTATEVAPQPVPQPVQQPAAEPQPAPPSNATTSMPTETQTSAPQATATMHVPPQPQSGGRVNLLFAIILIVVGIGVLVVLLRASD